MAEVIEKTCKSCTETKPLVDFPKRKDSKDGHRNICKVCKDSVDKAWKAANPDKDKAYKSAWVERNLDRRREQASAWQARNLDKARIYANNRRALLCEASLPGNAWELLIAFYGEKCAQCGAESDLTMDHVIPLSKGGTHTLDNLQILCARDNKAKGNRNSNDYRKGAILDA